MLVVEVCSPSSQLLKEVFHPLNDHSGQVSVNLLPLSLLCLKVTLPPLFWLSRCCTHLTLPPYRWGMCYTVSQASRQYDDLPWRVKSNLLKNKLSAAWLSHFFKYAKWEIVVDLTRNAEFYLWLYITNIIQQPCESTFWKPSWLNPWLHLLTTLLLL